MKASNRIQRAVAAVLACLGALTLVVGFATVTAGGASAANDDSQVCDGLDSGKIDTKGDPLTVELAAPDGFLIYRYCVKAGSINNENGPVYVDVVPPVASLTISYPNGKAVSHYSFAWSAAPTGTPTTGTPTTDTPTTETPTTESPAPSVTVLPSESEVPNASDTPTVLPTEVDAGTAGSSSGSNGWALIGSGLALLMLSIGLLVARRPRGTHGF